MNFKLNPARIECIEIEYSIQIESSKWICPSLETTFW